MLLIQATFPREGRHAEQSLLGLSSSAIMGASNGSADLVIISEHCMSRKRVSPECVGKGGGGRDEGKRDGESERRRKSYKVFEKSSLPSSMTFVAGEEEVVEEQVAFDAVRSITRRPCYSK